MDLPRLNNLTDLATLLRSIDNSETSEMGFDMASDYEDRDGSNHPCGTACCIGGWVQACNQSWSMCLEDSVYLLSGELSWDECEELCFPAHFAAWGATPEQAARAVEILRDTGKTDWPRAMREGAR